MEPEKIKALLLATACLFMACLNLWNLFKDWFDERYERRREDKNKTEHLQPEESIPDIIGKSKFQLKSDRIYKEKNLPKEEIAEPEEWFPEESEKVEEDEPFLSIPMEPTVPIRDDFESLEDESLLLLTEKDRSPFNTGTTLDEFELVVKTLQGKQITEEEEIEVSNIIPKIEGSVIYKQFTDQIQGAEERAMEILNRIDSCEQNSVQDSDKGFDLSKYIRE